MSYGYGTVAYANASSGLQVTVAAIPSDGTGYIRAFDFCLLNTSTVVAFFQGTNTSGAGMDTSFSTAIVKLDKNQIGFASNAGIRFSGNIITSAGAVAGNVATISYIREF